MPVHRSRRTGGPVAALALTAASSAFGGGRYAAAIVDFVQGADPVPGFADPNAALGPPERFTGEGLFPSVVSPFSPPYLPDEIVAIGFGGSITLAFDEPVLDDPSNPFGIDLILFGNAGLIDGDYPNGLVAGAFSVDGGVVEVSADGVSWHVVAEVGADGLLPTLGFLDSGPYDAVPGRVPSDFCRPADPTLTLPDLLGLDHAALTALYDGSGGGTGVDLAWAGIASASFVRISVPLDAPFNIEIDAVADASPALASPDLNGDGVVDGADLGVLLAGWGGGATDLDGDGTVDGADLGVLLAAWNGD
ncbi:MAG: hypothetical protein KDA22_06515 [Phycisphaerales bacterium]|nr:hypothetical protein [Phycisphaerales bacterium]